MTGRDLPKFQTAIPGPHSKELAKRLRAVECSQITYISDRFPVFWKSALGANVCDEDGNIFVDFGSAFGVQGIGHTHPRIVRIIQEQSEKLIHGMGDVHPTELKIRLAEKLRDITPGDLSQVIFSSSGAEAVESALKTACMYTKKAGVIAFEDAYHGLTYGTLAATHRLDFKEPFLKQIGRFVTHVPFPDSYHSPSTSKSGFDEILVQVDKRIKSRWEEPVGAVLLEPIQGRGGVAVPPDGFLSALKVLCEANGVLLILDEIMTGFGRTGAWFACEHENVVPDLLVAGKGMTGGFPISACIGSEQIMSAWGTSGGESIHTSTFLGSPLGAAAALETIRVLEDENLIRRSEQLGEKLIGKLRLLSKKHSMIGDVRGKGLMIGVEIVRDRNSKEPGAEETTQLIEELLADGIIVLPCGPGHNVLSITPPFVITEEQVDYAIGCLDRRLGERMPELTHEPFSN